MHYRYTTVDKAGYSYIPDFCVSLTLNITHASKTELAQGNSTYRCDSVCFGTGCVPQKCSHGSVCRRHIREFSSQETALGQHQQGVIYLLRITESTTLISATPFATECTAASVLDIIISFKSRTTLMSPQGFDTQGVSWPGALLTQGLQEDQACPEAQQVASKGLPALTGIVIQQSHASGIPTGKSGFPNARGTRDCWGSPFFCECIAFQLLPLLMHFPQLC